MDVWILDGIWGNHRRWQGLARHLESRGATPRIWEYDNSGRTGLGEAGACLAAELTAARHRVHLVGYSMGGLVVREAVRRAPGQSVGRVALLNSPHAGSVFARMIPLPAAREMRPGSGFLSDLDRSPWEPATLAVWCPFDLVVVPGHSARWARATKLVRSIVPAHVWPVFSPRLHREIGDFLLGEPPNPPN